MIQSEPVVVMPSQGPTPGADPSMASCIWNAARPSAEGLMVHFGERMPSGEQLWCPVSALRHMIVAGASGFGKSGSLRYMIATMALWYSPEDIRFVLIDLKQVELARFNALPHLMCDVVDEPSRVESIVDALASEMERRFRIIKAAGCFNVADCPDRMPIIFVVVDEIAELFLNSTWKDTQRGLAALMARSRACGFVWVLSTQRPTRDLLPGILVANASSRLSFRTASRVDSQVIIGVPGAESLKAPGEFLLSTPALPEGIIRGRAPYLTAEEVGHAVDLAQERWSGVKAKRWRLGIEPAAAASPRHASATVMPDSRRHSEQPDPKRTARENGSRATMRSMLTSIAVGIGRVVRMSGSFLRGLLLLARDLLELVYQAMRYVLQRQTKYLKRHMPRHRPRRCVRRRRRQ